MFTAVEGFKVGHYSDAESLTGCSVVLCPPKTRASCEVRGSSPGSRELALLAPDKKMDEVHAILLTGGSAFGLAAADGVMKFLEDRDVGYPTPWGKVPLVPSAVIFDLNVGRFDVRPNSDAGYQACKTASSANAEEGNVGAGTGATVGKWNGLEHCMKGGMGSASTTVGDLVVGCLVVVNAVGDIVDKTGKIIAGARSKQGQFFGEIDPHRTFTRGKVMEKTNTTLAIVATNADFSKVELFRVSQRMHDGFARAINPVHTSFDGDISFALSWGSVHADLDFVAEIAASITADAIRRAVTTARTTHGIPGVASQE
jgi:L-aminopeptidase/D-esterase-like protein